MKKIDTGYYQSQEGQTAKRILVSAYLNLIRDVIKKNRHSHVIQMGYGDGEVVKELVGKVADITVLEGDSALAKAAESQWQNDQSIRIIHTLFEAYTPDQPFANLILGNHVLEHVDDPLQVLRQSLIWLKKGGQTLLSVPNATSLHRRIGVKLGLLKSVYGLNDQDKRVGHQRVYDQDSFRNDIKKAGYAIVEFGGFNLKLVSQKQMQDWSSELLQAIYEVSREVPPELCSNLYALCQK